MSALNSIPAPSPLDPPLPRHPGERWRWGQLHGASRDLVLACAAERSPGLVLAVVEGVQEAAALQSALGFFLETPSLPLLGFPDWETLPYDIFSPLPELVSERLLTLHRLPRLKRGILIVPVSTLMQRLPPRDYVDRHTLVLGVGDRLDLAAMRQRLEGAGYRWVSQVIAHGEYAVRGSLLDLFPMGSDRPLRIDLFDEVIESIRTFDPETQRSQARIEQVRILPAREIPLDTEAIAGFRRRYRAAISGDPQRSLIYREVSNGQAPGGIEYYLPLFFDQTATLFDYLPDQVLVIESEGSRASAEHFFATVQERYAQRCHDSERPPLAPDQLYLRPDELAGALNRLPLARTQTEPASGRPAERSVNFATLPLPDLRLQVRASDPAQALKSFIEAPGRRVLFVAESNGRRELLREQLKGFGIPIEWIGGWHDFVNGTVRLGLTVASLDQGLWLEGPDLAVLTETQLYGERIRQERRRREGARDSDAIVRNLTELSEGAPVVHEEHGVGRYRGLQILEVGGITAEFLTIEYANGDKLYVPVSSLHRVSRYTGVSPDQAPLHRLGGDQWDRVKRRAARKAYDVAAEILEIHARRAARPGVALPDPGPEYAAFAAAFPFEETPDQQRAIEAVLADLLSPKPMDRVICGDVGFGKTEVAMRAAFVAVQGGRQVAVLVPTTLLAQQHYQNFLDRFADWPVRIASLSRLRTSREQQAVLAGLAEGTIDIVIGTHKLLQSGIRFKDLGLVIIDEEHRFGVRHKEHLKALRAEVDVLTLTATPIPRTLNMAVSGLRDFSIISTPPVERHPIKTFVTPWNDTLIQEAIQRELKRGGQVYFLHNTVETIDQQAARLATLVPEARIAVAHGQMRERELERIMRDFYHQRFNLLVCTTIIESGIDVPTANTILINRADQLGLAQLHQLRGRVGRSHHRAYAYLLTPPPAALTAEAKKRLEAIEAMGELGAGFTLATHDLEIRGAGELLGDDQSGQINEVGFTLYMEFLERAVAALKAGRLPELDRPLDHGAEIDLGIPALLPSDYLPDVQARLVLYKRLASARDREELREIEVEMIDRLGPLPEPARNLVAVTDLRLQVQPLGIRKIEAGPAGGRILFTDAPRIEPERLICLLQSEPQSYRLEGGNTLKFCCPLPQPQERIGKVRQLIEHLVG